MHICIVLILRIGEIEYEIVLEINMIMNNLQRIMKNLKQYNSQRNIITEKYLTLFLMILLFYVNLPNKYL